jgi:hypothetical protein
MAEQSKMLLPTTLFDFSTDHKNKTHIRFVIWSSIQFQLFPKNDFQNGAII